MTVSVFPHTITIDDGVEPDGRKLFLVEFADADGTGIVWTGKRYADAFVQACEWLDGETALIDRTAQ